MQTDSETGKRIRKLDARIPKLKSADFQTGYMDSEARRAYSETHEPGVVSEAAERRTRSSGNCVLFSRSTTHKDKGLWFGVGLGFRV